ncbi:hypothetical protein B0O99DRAFT_635667 [Bisporella sp. PMI_857]|nr:hypothetical protein B0O99DRAFT_635667 [Bisporella sp. PMI_857]
MSVGGYGPTIIGVMWAETALALVFVLLRLWTRMKINHVIGWDDYLLVLSWLLLTPYTIAVHVAALKGFGRHSYELDPNDFIEATKAEIIGQTFCIIGIATSKASVAIFLLRITVVQWHRWVLYAVMVGVAVPCFFCALFDFIRCDPIAAVWNPTLPAKCWVSTEGFTALSITVGVASAAADFVLAALPWFTLWNLQMKQKEKILIASSMSLGFFAMVCGIIRAIALEGLTARSDYSYETVGLILWSSTELMVTILTATIPTLRPLYNQLRGYVTSEDKYGSHKRSRSRGYRLDNIESEASNKITPALTPHSNYGTVIVTANADNQSDKSILGRTDAAIVRTDQVTVEYEDEWPGKKQTNAWSRQNTSEQEAV